MPTVEEMIQTQLRNIETKTGMTYPQLQAVVLESGLTKHTAILNMLKERFGLGHGDANTLALLSRKADGASIAAEKTARGEDPADEWYSGPKAALRPIHDALLAAVAPFGEDIESTPKKTYVSLRRKKQFAMVGPGSNTLVDVGLNVKGDPGNARLKLMPAGGMFTHRVRVGTLAEVDQELLDWLRVSYEAAG